MKISEASSRSGIRDSMRSPRIRREPHNSPGFFRSPSAASPIDPAEATGPLYCNLLYRPQIYKWGESPKVRFFLDPLSLFDLPRMVNGMNQKRADRSHELALLRSQPFLD